MRMFGNNFSPFQDKFFPTVRAAIQSRPSGPLEPALENICKMIEAELGRKSPSIVTNSDYLRNSDLAIHRWCSDHYSEDTSSSLRDKLLAYVANRQLNYGKARDRTCFRDRSRSESPLKADLEARRMRKMLEDSPIEPKRRKVSETSSRSSQYVHIVHH